MLNLHTAQIESLSVHRVGNKSRNEGIFISENPYPVNDELHALLKEYFLKPFRDKEENLFQFVHEVDLEFHELYNLVNNMFNNPNHSHKNTQKIARLHLDQSQQTHIKSEDEYVTFFENILIDNERTKAFGIYKKDINHE